MKKDYNELTKTLLAAGYDAENYPKEMVHIAGHSCFDKENPLNNFYGGFEYNRAYTRSLVYQTGCGKFVLGQNVLSDFSCNGIDWTHENFNPVVRCPYDKPDCSVNNPALHGTNGGGLYIQCWCACHPTDAAYDYNNSFEKAEHDRQAEKSRKYQEYADAHNGRICSNHMHYDERTREWSLRYDPGDCAHLSCSGYCPILGKELDRKKGNVFYDIKITQRRYDLDGTLFEGQVDTTVTKGIKKFKSSVSMDICRSYIKMCREDLIRDVMQNDYHSELFFAKYYGRQFQVEVLNIRAEHRENRNLTQDMEDTKNGINVQYASDNEKRSKAEKKEKRKKARQDRIHRLEKKLLTVGYSNLEPHSLDRVHADKWLGEERIDELEKLRLQQEQKKMETPQQITMADFLENDVA